jgi:hypothetical protein
MTSPSIVGKRAPPAQISNRNYIKLSYDSGQLRRTDEAVSAPSSLVIDHHELVHHSHVINPSPSGHPTHRSASHRIGGCALRGTASLRATQMSCSVRRHSRCPHCRVLRQARSIAW